MSHSRSLSEMTSYGTGDPIQSWLLSYFSFKNQVAQVNGRNSEPRLVSGGVIQGSVLGSTDLPGVSCRWLRCYSKCHRVSVRN